MTPTTLSIVLAATIGLMAPVAAQQLENHHTPETSGTTRPPARDTMGVTTPAGEAGPASETRMPPQRPVTTSTGRGAAQAGAPDTTRELFQH